MNILFIGPNFFNYHLYIKSEIELLGHHVIYFPEKKVGLVYRILRNISTALLYKYNLNYQYSILKKVKVEEINIFFLIRGEHISEHFLKEIVNRNPKIRLISYQWDSLDNNANFKKIYKYFHSNFTFDYRDSQSIHDLKYLPLFYLPSYLQIRADSYSSKKYCFLFIGTFTKSRYNKLLEIKKVLNSYDIQIKYILVASIFEFMKYIISSRKFDKAFRVKGLFEDEILEYFRNSKYILDIPSSTQSGFSIRTIESFAAGLKVVSTLKYASGMPLSECIYYLDLKNFEPSTLDYISSNKDNVSLDRILSLREWVKQIF